jgi:beta-galactosidase
MKTTPHPKSLSVAAAATLMVLYAACCTSRASGAIDGPMNFNGDWRLLVGDPKGAEAPSFDDSKWQSVTLPRAFNEDDAFKNDIRELATGVAWYRKTFKLPDGAAGRKVFIEFEGVRFGARVYVNGTYVVTGDNGVMAFGADISALVKPGDNVVAVRCDSSWNYREEKRNSGFQWNDRNFYANYGGINKNVVLHVRGKLHQTLPLLSTLGTTGVYVYARDIDVAGKKAIVVAESQVKNDDVTAKRVGYQVTVKDLDGKEVARFASAPVEVGPGETKTLTASSAVAGLNFWSWGYGYLYTVTTSLVVDGATVDSVDTRTGFRKTEFAGGALKLNDRTLHLKGYAQRTTNEWPALGIDVPPWVSDFSNGLMVASNGNLVRWMHVTPSKQDVESCDRVGLIQAMPAGDSEKDVTGPRWEQRIEVMRDAIVYNRNNPSIVFYEAGNKGISDAHMDEMLALKKQFDPHGGRAMGSREMLGNRAAEWGGEMLYINKSSYKPLWATEYMRDESARAYIDELTPPYHKDGDGPDHQGKPAREYNRNQDSMVAETVTRWYDYWRERPGTGKRVSAGGVNIIFSDSNTHHRGSANYRRSGEVDAMRLPKEGFFAHKVMWDGWVDPKPAIHLVGHWNYKAGATKDVQVVSSADRVELMLNGKSFGQAEQTNRFMFTFPKVGWQPGTLIAVGYDAAGKKVAEAKVETVGEPAAIKLTPHVSPAGFRADGSDLALVDVEVVDKEGRRVPTAFNMIKFDVDGPGEWRGGIATGPDNYILSKSLPVELGINRVIVRSTTAAGAITIRATAEGLTSASTSVQSKTSDPRILPGNALAPSLARGATPAGDSVTPTRVSLEIVSARAGEGRRGTPTTEPTEIGSTTQPASSDPKSAYDDNEETTWASSGLGKDAWIEFELKQPAEVSEITMRLSGWRSTSYPIRVSVDGKEAWAGATPKSLGYVTLAFKPVRGKTVKIELIGPARTSDDDFDLTEVTGKKLTEGREGGKSTTLAIGEAEIYGPLPKP